MPHPRFAATLTACAACASLVLASPALAQPGTATIMADNGALMVMETSPGQYNVIPASVAGIWPKMHTFAFDLPDDAQGLRSCKLHIIAWGDGAVRQGLVAHVAGPAAFTYTGAPNGPLNKVRLSSVTHPGTTAAGQAMASTNAGAAAIINGAAPLGQLYMSPTIASGGSGWGNYTLPALTQASELRFVWDGTGQTLNANPRNYRVVSMPCTGIANPVEPTAMKGDHFQCYQVMEGQALKPEQITLRDQFGRKQVVLGKPVYMCNPTVKTHGKKTYEVERPERHLVCYDIIRQPPPRRPIRVQTGDQFTSQQMTLGGSRIVCVPSSKKRLDGNDLPLK
ncbi:MAG: hypothetical protein H6918_10495 [Sphingomonadaceae bacterium]|nr:hypothetical protein [Sphingomonadaceae bacterium]